MSERKRETYGSRDNEKYCGREGEGAIHLREGYAWRTVLDNRRRRRSVRQTEDRELTVNKGRI